MMVAYSIRQGTACLRSSLATPWHSGSRGRATARSLGVAYLAFEVLRDRGTSTLDLMPHL